MPRFLVAPNYHVHKVSVVEADHLLRKGWRVAVREEILAAQTFNAVVDETTED